VNDVGDGSNSSTSLAGNNSNIKDFIVIVDGTSKRQQRKRKRKLLLQEQKQRQKLHIQADLQSIEKSLMRIYKSCYNIVIYQVLMVIQDEIVDVNNVVHTLGP